MDTHTHRFARGAACARRGRLDVVLVRSILRGGVAGAICMCVCVFECVCVCAVCIHTYILTDIHTHKDMNRFSLLPEARFLRGLSMASKLSFPGPPAEMGGARLRLLEAAGAARAEATRGILLPLAAPVLCFAHNTQVSKKTGINSHKT